METNKESLPLEKALKIAMDESLSEEEALERILQTLGDNLMENPDDGN